MPMWRLCTGPALPMNAPIQMHVLCAPHALLDKCTAAQVEWLKQLNLTNAARPPSGCTWQLVEHSPGARARLTSTFSNID